MRVQLSPLTQTFVRKRSGCSAYSKTCNNKVAAAHARQRISRWVAQAPCQRTFALLQESLWAGPEGGCQPASMRKWTRQRCSLHLDACWRSMLCSSCLLTEWLMAHASPRGHLPSWERARGGGPDTTQREIGMAGQGCPHASSESCYTRCRSQHVHDLHHLNRYAVQVTARQHSLTLSISGQSTAV